MSAQTKTELTADDFKTNQDVRWCPGCGDYAILAAVQRLLPELGVPREKFVFVSGIGCAARFPYYMETYGVHSIHGRAPALATGIKVANPELSVWIVSGDGDALSIGGNHMLHILRRNLDVNILLFNNRIYGLTKGQTSPTSPLGTKTKTTPFGSADQPVNPLAFALGAQASFVARGIDRQIPQLAATMKAAFEHRGTSIIEIMQNCNIFNDGAFDHFTDRAVRKERQLELEHGKPLVFDGGTKGLRWREFGFEVVNLDAVDPSEIVVHDETRGGAYAFALAEIEDRDALPFPIGILRREQRPVYEDLVHQQPDPNADLQALIRGRETWEVEG